MGGDFGLLLAHLPVETYDLVYISDASEMVGRGGTPRLWCERNRASSRTPFRCGFMASLLAWGAFSKLACVANQVKGCPEVGMDAIGTDGSASASDKSALGTGKRDRFGLAV
jgi:hypothetical protein